MWGEKSFMYPTMKDIANLAGTSRGTVDRILHDRTGVNSETKKRVMEVIEKVGYRPNWIGKALSKSRKPISIGIILLKKNDPVFQAIYAGASDAIKDFQLANIKPWVFFTESESVDEQLQHLQSLYQQELQGIAISPLNDEKIINKLQTFTDKGIKIVTFNTDIEGIDKICFIGQNLYQSGRLAGFLIGEIISQSPTNILIVSGPEQIWALKQRIEGFIDYLNDSGKPYNIVNTILNITSNEQAYKSVKSILERETIHGIYITARGIGGVCSAIKDSNKQGVKVVCFDTASETIDYIKQGCIDFTITQDPYAQGYTSVKTLVDFLIKGNIPKQKVCHTKLEIICKENLIHIGDSSNG